MEACVTDTRPIWDVSCQDTSDLQIGLGFLGVVWDHSYHSLSFSLVSFPSVHSFLHTAGLPPSCCLSAFSPWASLGFQFQGLLTQGVEPRSTVFCPSPLACQSLTLSLSSFMKRDPILVPITKFRIGWKEIFWTSNHFSCPHFRYKLDWPFYFQSAQVSGKFWALCSAYVTWSLVPCLVRQSTHTHRHTHTGKYLLLSLCLKNPPLVDCYSHNQVSRENDGLFSLAQFLLV